MPPLVAQGGGGHGHRRELVDEYHIKILGQQSGPQPAAQQKAHVIERQRGGSVLPGADLAADDLDAVVGLPADMCIAGVDLSLRVIGPPGEHRHRMPPPYQLLANLRNAELLGVVVLGND